MPKNDDALQKELGMPKAYNVTPISDDYPRIISHVEKGKGVDTTIEPTSPGSAPREGYDENNDPEINLRLKYIKANDIEVSPKSFKE